MYEHIKIRSFNPYFLNRKKCPLVARFFHRRHNLFDRYFHTLSDVIVWLAIEWFPLFSDSSSHMILLSNTSICCINSASKSVLTGNISPLPPQFFFKICATKNKKYFRIVCLYFKTNQAH